MPPRCGKAQPCKLLATHDTPFSFAFHSLPWQTNTVNCYCRTAVAFIFHLKSFYSLVPSSSIHRSLLQPNWIMSQFLSDNYQMETATNCSMPLTVVGGDAAWLFLKSYQGTSAMRLFASTSLQIQWKRTAGTVPLLKVLRLVLIFLRFDH